MQPHVSLAIFSKVHMLITRFCSINDLDELPELGMFLNDLNQHGQSKEMVLAGWQHNSK